MKCKSLFLILIIAVSMSWGWSAYADESKIELSRLHQQLNVLIDSNRHREAIPLAQEIIAFNTGLHGLSHISVGRAQFQLAELYWANGQYRKADGPYKLALWVFEQRLPPADAEAEQVVMRLVYSYTEQNLWQQVNILLLHWFDITQQALGNDAPQTIQAMKRLAALYRKNNRESEAQKIEQQVNIVNVKK